MNRIIGGRLEGDILPSVLSSQLIDTRLQLLVWDWIYALNLCIWTNIIIINKTFSLKWSPIFHNKIMKHLVNDDVNNQNVTIIFLILSCFKLSEFVRHHRWPWYCHSCSFTLYTALLHFLGFSFSFFFFFCLLTTSPFPLSLSHSLFLSLSFMNSPHLRDPSLSPPPPSTSSFFHTHQTLRLKLKSDFPSLSLSLWKRVSGSFVHPPADVASSRCHGNRVYTYCCSRRESEMERRMGCRGMREGRGGWEGWYWVRISG